MSITVVQAPTAEPLSVGEVAQHLELHSDDTTYTDLLPKLIAQARRHVERECGLALMPQRWQYTLPGFPDGILTLPGAPITALVSLQYVDGNGSLQTCAIESIDTDLPGRRIAPLDSAWPSTARRLQAVRITYDLGYADADAVPADIKAALKLIIGDLFANREAAVVGASYIWTPAVDRLLWSYREMGT